MLFALPYTMTLTESNTVEQALIKTVENNESSVMVILAVYEGLEDLSQFGFL